MLHPRHKLAYFQRVGWEPDWIATARNIVRAEYDRKYARALEVTTAIVEEETGQSKVNCPQSCRFACS